MAPIACGPCCFVNDLLRFNDHALIGGDGNSGEAERVGSYMAV